MVGVITGWDVLAHPISTIRCFGWRIFFRAAIPWEDRPFLALLQEAGVFRAADANVPTIVIERCIGLELRAKRVYAALVKKLDHHTSAGAFFAALSEQEQFHADLLEVARGAAARTGWRANHFDAWQNCLPGLEQKMTAAEAASQDVDSIDAALRLVIEIESAEVNQVFAAVMAATDAAFVRRLKPFREAMETHIAYIVEQVPKLSPKLESDCDRLRSKFPCVRR